MKNARGIALFTCLMLIAISVNMWAADDMDDAFAEAEAQKDMLAFVQTTAVIQVA